MKKRFAKTGELSEWFGGEMIPVKGVDTSSARLIDEDETVLDQAIEHTLSCRL
ncbi:MAG TPA: hypothetical protein VF255_03395 [Solirubrobacterales bacterium]